jgi:hypothetical protein
VACAAWRGRAMLRMGSGPVQGRYGTLPQCARRLKVAERDATVSTVFAGGLRSAHTDLVQMSEQVRRVLVDAVSPGAVELTPSIPAGEETDAKGPSPLGGEEIPDAVADDEAGVRGDAEAIGGGQEEIRVRLGVSDVVTCHHRNPRWQTEKVDGVAGRLPSAAGGEGERHAEFVQTLEERDRASQRTAPRAQARTCG